MHNFSYWEQKYFWKPWDFTIIGSGITGLTSAYFIKRKYPKANVAVLERGFLPTGASTKNAGFACFGSMSEILDDLSIHPESKVLGLLRDRYAGLESLRQLLGDKKIGFDPCGGYEVFTEKEEALFLKCSDQIQTVNAHLESIIGRNVFSIQTGKADSLGLTGIKHIIFNRNEGSIDTGLMMQSLIGLVRSAGIEIFNGIDVKSIEYNDETPSIHSNIGTFKSKKVIVATNGFAKTILPGLDVSPGRAQVLITKPIPGLKLSGTFHHNQGYNYFRNIDNRVLLGGGRHLAKTDETTTEMGQTEEIQYYLEGLLSDHILHGQKIEIEHRWSGIMGVGPSKDVILKTLGPSTICAVRLGGMGVALGTSIGKQVASMV